MEQPARVDPPMWNMAQCYQYTSSDEDADQEEPSTEGRAAGKRPMTSEPSRKRGVSPG